MNRIDRIERPSYGPFGPSILRSASCQQVRAGYHGHAGVAMLRAKTRVLTALADKQPAVAHKPQCHPSRAAEVLCLPNCQRPDAPRSVQNTKRASHLEMKMRQRKNAAGWHGPSMLGCPCCGAPGGPTNAMAFVATADRQARPISRPLVPVLRLLGWEPGATGCLSASAGGALVELTEGKALRLPPAVRVSQEFVGESRRGRDPTEQVRPGRRSMVRG